jgi:hypothetical protein
MSDSGINRHIEGGNATFSAGCALSGFNLNPSIRITNQLSIKADANTILTSWRPRTKPEHKIVEAVLHSVAGAPRFCYKAHSSIGGLWNTNTIAGFHQPEHALAALKYFSGNSDVDAQVVYTVYFRAPKELSDAVLLDVEEIMSQTAEAEVVWEKPKKDMHTKQDMVTLRLSGTDREEIVDMKRILEAIFAGRVATAGRDGSGKRYEIWHDFFATPPGYVWLQHLARDKGVIIMSDKLQRRLRIYSDEESGIDCGNVERRIAEKVYALDALEEIHTIQFDFKQFRDCLVLNKVAEVQRRLGKSSVSLDIVTKTLILHCSREDAYAIALELSLPDLLPLVCLMCPQCGDMTTDIRFSNCGHMTCRACFDHQLQVASSDLTGNHFPLLCWHEGCELPIAISDLRKHATATMFDALLKASLTYYIRSCPDLYRNCRTPDCRSVYDRSGHYEIFTCPTCLEQTCTLCHAKPHVGWTCEEHKSHLRTNKRNERLLDDYKATAGTKDCPKCATLIEKVDGCNHVECSGCHGHICWECVRVFASSEAAYKHMNDVHGGNGYGLVDEEADDELEFDNDEAEDGNEDDNERDDRGLPNLVNLLHEFFDRVHITPR